MFRLLTFSILIAGALLLTQGAAQAQDQDLPVAGPDEIVLVGEVPAPPGTDVWAFYFVSEFFSCGQTTADENSRFVLIVDASCATPLGPAVCWGELPDWKQGPEELCDGTLSPVGGGDSPGAGETVDMGLLGRTAVPGTPDPVPVQPVDGYPTEIDQPAAAPDEIIFVGEAPASPGAEITAQYLSLTAGEVVICGRTVLDSQSAFTLVVDATCADEAVGPLICWGGLRSGFCQGMSDGLFIVVDRSGRTFDVGLLAPREVDLSNTILPNVGAGFGDGQSSAVSWLLLSAYLALAAALAAGAGSLVLRRSR